MSRFLSWLALSAVLLGSMAGSAATAAPSIKDDAGLFSEKALESGRETIRKIDRRYGRQLLVETFAGIPEGARKEYSRAVKDRFFSEWAADRANHKLKGVGFYILICQEPSHVQVVVSKRISLRVFTLDDRKELNHLLEQNLWSRPDQALVDAVTFVESALHDNLGYSNQRPDDGAIYWLPLVYTLILMLVGVWLLVGLMRTFSRPRPGHSSNFLGSLLGGLFGATAGMWIYDSFFNAPASPAEGEVESDTTQEGNGDF